MHRPECVGCWTQRLTTPAGGGTQTTENYGYLSTNNRVDDITVGASTVRSFAYDAAGNMTSDTRSGSTYAYTYNKAGRLATVSYAGNLRGTYTYNGRSQLARRVLTNLDAAACDGISRATDW